MHEKQTTPLEAEAYAHEIVQSRPRNFMTFIAIIGLSVFAMNATGTLWGGLAVLASTLLMVFVWKPTEHGFIKTALLGMALAIIGSGVLVWHGPSIAPEGDVIKLIIFDLTFSLFLLNLVALRSFAQFTKDQIGKWRLWNVRLYTAAFFIENMQIWRGFDPRFTKAGSVSDVAQGLLFLLVALGIFGGFIYLAVKFFKYRSTERNGPLVLGIRYGSVSVIVSFVIGLVISILKGFFGPSAIGDLLPAHVFGPFALLALPILGWLLMKTEIKSWMGRLLMHFAGVVWLIALYALAYQTGQIGRILRQVGIFGYIWYFSDLPGTPPVAPSMLPGKTRNIVEFLRKAWIKILLPSGLIGGIGLMAMVLTGGLGWMHLWLLLGFLSPAILALLIIVIESAAEEYLRHYKGLSDSDFLLAHPWEDRAKLVLFVVETSKSRNYYIQSTLKHIWHNFIWFFIGTRALATMGPAQGSQEDVP
jgi:hypothetical protein